MSSREFLVLIQHLPDTSEYKRARSATGWSEAEEIAAKAHEVAATNLASKYVGHTNAPEFKTFIPPKDRLSRAIVAAEEEEFADNARDEFLGNLFQP